MENLDRNLGSELRWCLYQRLELISDTTPDPTLQKTRFVFGLNRVWRGLLNLLADELVSEQQVDYLERCWLLEEKQSPKTLQRLWHLME